MRLFRQFQGEVRHSPGPHGPGPPAQRQEKSRADLSREGESQRRPGLTIDQIVVPQRERICTPNGVFLYARWLLLRANFLEFPFRDCMKRDVGWYFATLAGMRRHYPTDLSDAEWNYIEPHMPAPKEHGRPRLHSPREILEAILYVLRSGCQWRLLPQDFPRWPTVYYYFRAWRIDGTWERINRAIRERLRVRLKRDPQPSAGT